MAVKLLGAMSRGGPRNGSSWTSPWEAGEPLVAYPLSSSQSVSVNGTSEQPVWVAPLVSTYTADGINLDGLASDNVLGYLNAAYLGSMGVALTVNLAGLTLGFFLRRAGAVVGGGAFAGWAAASNPAIAAYSMVKVPFLTSNTALVAPGGATVTATNALLPFQPGDIVTLSVATSGATTVPFLIAAVDGT
jgi:hypothetical protein